MTPRVLGAEKRAAQPYLRQGLSRATERADRGSDNDGQSGVDGQALAIPNNGARQGTITVSPGFKRMFCSTFLPFNTSR